MDINNYTRDQCASWLKNIEQSASGTADEMKNSVRKFALCPNLQKWLDRKDNRNYQLDPLLIPSVTEIGITNEELFPTVTDEMFYSYCSMKKNKEIYGSKKKQAECVSVKVHQQLNNTFAKAMIIFFMVGRLDHL